MHFIYYQYVCLLLSLFLSGGVTLYRSVHPCYNRLALFNAFIECPYYMRYIHIPSGQSFAQCFALAYLYSSLHMEFSLHLMTVSDREVSKSMRYLPVINIGPAIFCTTGGFNGLRVS